MLTHDDCGIVQYTNRQGFSDQDGLRVNVVKQAAAAAAANNTHRGSIPKT